MENLAAPVAELGYAHGLGPCGFGLAGSSPAWGNFKREADSFAGTGGWLFGTLRRPC
jgi:hypothetical protein